MQTDGQLQEVRAPEGGSSKRPAPDHERQQVLEEAAHRLADAIANFHPHDRLSRLPPRAFVVGGWVRDQLLGRNSSDIDLEVFNVTRDELVRALRTAFPGEQIVASKEERGPFKVIFGRLGFLDVTLAEEDRSRASSLQASKDPLSAQVERAARRRDYTCNSLYYDPLNRQFLDPLGGRTDIECKVLRLSKKYFECPLKEPASVRGVRLEAQLGFTWDPRSHERLREHVASVDPRSLQSAGNVPEIRKLICSTQRPSLAVRSALNTGLLAHLFPSVAQLPGIPQDTRHHPEGDVFEHTMLALDEAALLSRDLGESERFKVLLAALYHDTGKIDTTEVRHVGERKKISAINHEEHSWLRAKRELKALGLSRDVVGEVCALVRHHMRPLQITSREGMDMPSPAFDNQVRMLVRDVGPNRFDAFMILCRADRLGRGGGVQIQRAHDTLAPVQEASDRKGFRQTAAQKLLKGADLIELGFQPDEQLWRDIIVEVEKRRDDGKLGIPEEARRYVLRKYGLSKQEVSEAGVTTPQQLKRFYTSLSGAIKSGEVSSVAGIQEFLRDYQGASSSGGDPKHGHESDRELPEGALTFSVDTLSLGGQHVPLERGEHGGAGPSQDQGARTSLVSVLPKLSQSDTAAILSSGGVSAEGVSVNGQWSYAVRRSPADTFERMELEFRDLKDRLPRLSGISADISDVTLQFVTGSEADQIRRLGRRKIIEGEPFLAVSEESLRAVGLSAIEAFYKPEEKRIYVVKEAVENQPEWTTRSLLTHELTHALQVEGFPDFHKSIARFVSWGIRHSSVGSSASASALPIVAESVRARLNWLERHATYFEQCAFQYLIDDENDFTSIVRFAVNEDLLDLGKFRVPPSKEATEDIVAQIFATPEIADLLFRDDGVVCLDLDDRRREQSLDLVERFAKRYLKRSDVHVYSISSGKFVS